MPTIAIDTETFYSKKLKYTIKGNIAEAYVRNPLFDCYMVSVSDGASCWSGHPRDFNWSCLEGATLLSHNSYFDRQVIGEMQRRGLVPSFNYRAWHCTANLTSYVCNRRALDDAVEFLFGVRLSKDSRSDAEGKRWPEDFTPEQQKAMLEYARRDALWCWKLWDSFGANKWPAVEQKLSNITIEQGMRGIQIDRALLDSYLVATHEMKVKTEKLMPWLKDMDDEDWDWEGFRLSPTSTKCIAEQCRRVKIPCCPVKYEDEEAYQNWEDTHAPANPWIIAVSSWRSINKLYKTFQTVRSRLRGDNTLPFALKYFGAHTGRWSGDAKINMQNMRRVPMFCRQDGLMESDDRAISRIMKHHELFGKGEVSTPWPDEVRHAVDFRGLFTARPGKKMISSDLAQIEPRVLAWLSGNKAMLEQVRQGVSVYEAFARANMGYKEPGRMNKASDFYKLVKIQVLQLGYGAGWRKFIVTALKEYGVDLTENDPEWEIYDDPVTEIQQKRDGYGMRARQIVNDFRTASPLITSLWKRLEETFRSSVGNDFTMTLPNGRKMTYKNVLRQIRLEVDPDTKKTRKKEEYTAEVGGRRVSSYGGKLVENLVQAVARDVFSEGVARMHDAGLVNLFSSHDESILECDLDTSPREVERLMSITPDWIPGLPVAAEAKELERYAK